MAASETGGLSSLESSQGAPAGPRTEAGRRLWDYAHGFTRLAKPETRDKARDLIREEVLNVEREAASLAAPKVGADESSTPESALPPLDDFMRAYEMVEPGFDAGKDEPGDCECGLSMDAHCGGFALLHHDEFIVRAIHRRLSSLNEGGSAPPEPERYIETVVGNGDGTVTVTLDDGTERRITEVEYLAWPRRSVEERSPEHPPQEQGLMGGKHAVWCYLPKDHPGQCEGDQ